MNSKEENISQEVLNLINNLPEQTKEDFWIIFDYWNLFKKHKNLQKQATWKSCRKVTSDIFEAIITNLKKYSQQEICMAFENYAKILFDNNSYWTYVWSLPIFLTVKEGKYKDAPKKWVQKFHSDNFVFENFLIKNSNGNQYNIIEDPGPELTNEIIEGYKKLISSPDFVPNEKQKQQFIQTNIMMKEFFGRRESIFRESWVRLLVGCLYDNYIERSENCFPGHMCSKHIWEILMPTYLQELGMENTV